MILEIKIPEMIITRARRMHDKNARFKYIVHYDRGGWSVRATLRDAFKQPAFVHAATVQDDGTITCEQDYR
jgi:hypothetical protein